MKKVLSNKINELAKNREKFIVLIDFANKTPLLVKIDNLSNQDLLFSIDDSPVGHNLFINNLNDLQTLQKVQLNIIDLQINKFIKQPNIGNVKRDYQESFNNVRQNILYGNSYLTNLTYKTAIDLNISLKDLFFLVEAKYKVYFHKNIFYQNELGAINNDIELCDEFICFSPETFIKINNNIINTYPMKGTINSSIENAEQILYNNQKEAQEHNTIIDLLRNDLAMVGRNVYVDNAKYVQKINNNKQGLLAMSSQISAELSNNWQEKLGDILLKLLPAGSISGAPKEATLNIIQQSEKFSRQFYCGIIGYFDGKNFDSAVLIRYISSENQQNYFYSGGGITHNSNIVDEFSEVIDKIYLPLKNK